jgi:hypothetical protein
MWTDRLVLYGLAMVAAELQRRAQVSGGSKPASWLQRVANSLCPRRSLKDSLRKIKHSIRTK